MEGMGVAAVLVGIIGIILIFTILKINENLTRLNDKIDKTNEYLLKIKDNTK